MPSRAEREKHRMTALCLGETLRRARLRKGLSQEQIAHQAAITVRAYGCIERGVAPSGQAANPTIRTLLLVLDTLEIRVHLTLSSSTDDETGQLSTTVRPVAWPA
ncbi:helix-turn-helix transcriptional regulator [Microbacterium sp. J1-1]|uniref:helix-turn-helix transcriptional regulator n=1 Tax=Microbacterium sp. J1-1 TaxID=2992441 RepID=UPI0039B6F7F4